MTALLLHDCMTLVHVGRTSIPFTSNSLGLGHSFKSDSHYCKCEALYVLVTLTEPEIRGRVWRAISMFGSKMGRGRYIDANWSPIFEDLYSLELGFTDIYVTSVFLFLL